MESYNVKTLVRSCEKTYDDEQMRKNGIEVHELMFDDGMLPEEALIDKWIKIIDDFFKPEDAAEESKIEKMDDKGKKSKKNN